MIHILTLKCGTKYDYRSVNVLKRSIETHYNKPFTFYCMTDDPKGLDSDIVVLPMEEDLSITSILFQWLNQDLLVYQMDQIVF